MLILDLRRSDKKIILHLLKNTKNTLLAVLSTKLFVLMINLVNQLFFTGKKCNRFIEPILKEYDYCKKVIKKHVNKK